MVAASKTVSINPDKLAKVRGFKAIWSKRQGEQKFRVTPKTITVEHNKKVLSVTARKQEDVYESIKASLAFPPLYVISSMPSDYHALRSAYTLFERALIAGVKDNRFNDNLPYWHTVIGGYEDELRDNYRDYKQASLLVLVNVVSDSTATKLEKLRDILYMYAETPKILVVSGENAIAFCHRLFIKPSAILHLEPQKNIDL